MEGQTPQDQRQPAQPHHEQPRHAVQRGEAYRPPVPFQPAQAQEKYRPVELFMLIAVVMLGFAAFFVTFLLAPIVVILVVYLLLRFMERGTTPGARAPYSDSLERRARLDRERQARQDAFRGTERRIRKEPYHGPDRREGGGDWQ
jgi:hypothetical protein